MPKMGGGGVLVLKRLAIQRPGAARGGGEAGGKRGWGLQARVI